MPIYEYKCDVCSYRFERNHPMADPPVTECPECHAHGVRKLFSTGGIVGSAHRSSGGDFPMPPVGGGGCSSGGCGMGMCGMG
jgi:putative FmdB family regulatory protein